MKEELGDEKGAKKDELKSLSVPAKDAYEFANDGLIKKNNEDYKGALEAFNKANELNPNLENLHYQRGIVKVKLHDMNGACLDFRKAKEMGESKAQLLLDKYCGGK